MQVFRMDQQENRLELWEEIPSLQSRPGLAAAAQVIELAEIELRRHSYNVSKLAFFLAAQIGLSRQDCEMVALGGLLHDIGKLCIKRSILNKPSRLTTAEFEQIKQHTIIGANYLHNLGAPRPVYEIARYHHERVDGQGYPYMGLRANPFPLVHG